MDLPSALKPNQELHSSVAHRVPNFFGMLIAVAIPISIAAVRRGKLFAIRLLSARNFPSLRTTLAASSLFVTKDVGKHRKFTCKTACSLSICLAISEPPFLFSFPMIAINWAARLFRRRSSLSVVSSHSLSQTRSRRISYRKPKKVAFGSRVTFAPGEMGFGQKKPH